MTHICVGNLTIIGSDNGLWPGRRQAITWTNVGILLIGPLGTKFSEMFIEIHIFSFKKIHLKMSSGKWRPFCLGLNVLIKRCNLNSFVVFIMKIKWSLDHLISIIWTHIPGKIVLILCKFSIKTLFYLCMDFHYKDKTASQSVYGRNPYIWKDSPKIVTIYMFQYKGTI